MVLCPVRNTNLRHMDLDRIRHHRPDIYHRRRTVYMLRSQCLGYPPHIHHHNLHGMYMPDIQYRSSIDDHLCHWHWMSMYHPLSHLHDCMIQSIVLVMLLYHQMCRLLDMVVVSRYLRRDHTKTPADNHQYIDNTAQQYDYLERYNLIHRLHHMYMLDISCHHNTFCHQM